MGKQGTSLRHFRNTVLQITLSTAKVKSFFSSLRISDFRCVRKGLHNEIHMQHCKNESWGGSLRTELKSGGIFLSSILLERAILNEIFFCLYAARASRSNAACSGSTDEKEEQAYVVAFRITDASLMSSRCRTMSRTRQLHVSRPSRECSFSRRIILALLSSRRAVIGHAIGCADRAFRRHRQRDHALRGRN